MYLFLHVGIFICPSLRSLNYWVDLATRVLCRYKKYYKYVSMFILSRKMCYFYVIIDEWWAACNGFFEETATTLLILIQENSSWQSHTRRIYPVTHKEKKPGIHTLPSLPPWHQFLFSSFQVSARCDLQVQERGCFSYSVCWHTLAEPTID